MKMFKMLQIPPGKLQSQFGKTKPYLPPFSFILHWTTVWNIIKKEMNSFLKKMLKGSLCLFNKFRIKTM